MDGTKTTLNGPDEPEKTWVDEKTEELACSNAPVGDEDSFAEVEDEDSSEGNVQLHDGKGSRQAETKKGSVITVKITAKNILVGIIVLLLIWNTAAVFSLGAQINTLNQNLLLANGNLGNVGNNLVPSGGDSANDAAPSGTGNNNQGQPLAITARADDDPVLGSKDAPVEIIEFSDFQCPFCGKFFSETLPLLKQKYIGSGKAKIVFRDFPLGFHQFAQKASEASECADEQGKYWEMHDKIFENQGSLDTASLKKYAQEIGLDAVKFNACLDSGKFASEVQKDLADGQSYGVSGTPSFFINGITVVGAQPFSVFEQIIESELAKAAK